MRELLQSLYYAHNENLRTFYRASTDRIPDVSITPLTSFIFEYYIFNAIYQIDWISSLEQGNVVHHQRRIGGNGLSETAQQIELLSFLRLKLNLSNPPARGVFQGLNYIYNRDGDWDRIPKESERQSGEAFFENIDYFRNLDPDDFHSQIDGIFARFEQCILYVYKIRNNVFHGRKRLVDAIEPQMAKRIFAYFLFISTINSFFFLTVGHSLPDFSGLVNIRTSMLSQRSRSALSSSHPTLPTPFRYEEDQALNILFSQEVKKSTNLSIDMGALFYPSAGKDLLLPILLGLPFCSEYFFYDTRLNYLDHSKKSLSRQLSILDDSREPSSWTEVENGLKIDFTNKGIKRTVYWLSKDNTSFLRTGKQLSFYFHRGDSSEGGADQPWDSRLLPFLRKMIKPGLQALFLTDGCPRDFDVHQAHILFDMHGLQSVKDKYFAGTLTHESSELFNEENLHYEMSRFFHGE